MTVNNRFEIFNKKWRLNLDVFFLLAIVLLAFGLRYYKVGKDSFWLDEAGQAAAAIQPRIVDTLMVVRHQAGAMPLDYLVSRLMASISLSEKAMRFPSVVWGTLTIVFYFLLIREMDFPIQKPVSLLASLMLAFSPVFVQYSQEMRFYAALVFFYTASTLLLLRALKKPTIFNWFLYVLTALVGEYFHPYVLFAFITGAVLLISGKMLGDNGSAFRQWSDEKRLAKFLISGAILAAAYIPGYLFFNSSQVFAADLGFHLDLVLEGLGLQAIRLESGLGSFGLWHIFLMVGVIGGFLFAVVQYRKYWLVLSMLGAFFLQAFLIVGLDAYKHYFFSARQFIVIAPLVLVFVAIFVVELLGLVKIHWAKYMLWCLVVGFVVIGSFPYINAVYDYSKGSGRIVAQTIVSRYRAGQKILVVSSGYKIVLDYYFQSFEKSSQTLPTTLAVNNLDELKTAMDTTPDAVFVAAPSGLTADDRARIVSFGFKLVSGSKSGSDFLFARSP